MKDLLEKNGFEGNPQHDEDAKTNKFGYLLNMPIWSLSNETMEEYRKLAESKESEVRKLEKTTPEEMWLTDLELFQNSYEESLRHEKFMGTFPQEPSKVAPKKQTEIVMPKIVVKKQPKEASKKPEESPKKGVLGKRKREKSSSSQVSSSDSFIDDSSESSGYPE